jgi:hypothetical protein
MNAFAWWPVALILLLAPFAVYGYGWLERETLLSRHRTQLADMRDEALAERNAAYAAGKIDGAAEVRTLEQTEVGKTREVIREVEKLIEVPPPTPAEILALCRKSSSCREREALR